MDPVFQVCVCVSVIFPVIVALPLFSKLYLVTLNPLIETS